MIRGAAVALLLCAGPAPAETLDWLRAGIGFETRVNEAGRWAVPGGALYAADPLTLFGTEGDTIAVPESPARLVGLHETEFEGRTAVMALIWSDAVPVCGKDLTTIGVDTGLAGFLPPSAVKALDAYAVEFGGDLYRGTYAEQIDRLYPGPFLADLPDGTRFPVSGSGWGDGGYPVASLYSADGEMVALYAQFITGEDTGWLLPGACDFPTS